MRHDHAAYDADAEHTQTHWYADRNYHSEEAEEHLREAREEGHGTEGVAAATEERTGGLWDELAASIARARR